MKPQAAFGMNDGMKYFIIKKETAASSWKPVYKSEIKGSMDNLFQWNQVSMLESDLINDKNIEKEFMIELYESKTNGHNTYLGHTKLSIAEAQQSKKKFLIQDQQGNTDPAAYF